MTEAAFLVVVDVAGQPAAFTSAELTSAKERARELFASPPQAAPPAAEPLLDSRKLADFLGVGDTLLEQMAKDGRIPCVRIGKALRFDRNEVLTALQGSRHADNRTSPHPQLTESSGRKQARNRRATALPTSRTTLETR